MHDIVHHQVLGQNLHEHALAQDIDFGFHQMHQFLRSPRSLEFLKKSERGIYEQNYRNNNSVNFFAQKERRNGRDKKQKKKQRRYLPPKSRNDEFKIFLESHHYIITDLT